MEERNAIGDPDILSTEPGDEGATDIVGRTGEEMPLAMHDQGHRNFQTVKAAPALEDDEGRDTGGRFTAPR